MYLMTGIKEQFKVTALDLEDKFVLEMGFIVTCTCLFLRTPLRATSNVFIINLSVIWDKAV